MEYVLRVYDRRARLGRQLRRDRDAGPNDRERSRHAVASERDEHVRDPQLVLRARLEVGFELHPKLAKCLLRDQEVDHLVVAREAVPLEDRPELLEPPRPVVGFELAERPLELEEELRLL